MNRTFTPVPTRIQDGSEDVLPAAVISGAPLELQARTVRYVRDMVCHAFNILTSKQHLQRSQTGDSVGGFQNRAMAHGLGHSF